MLSEQSCNLASASCCLSCVMITDSPCTQSVVVTVHARLTGNHMIRSAAATILLTFRRVSPAALTSSTRSVIIQVY